MNPWVLEDGVLHLNHGSFGAAPAAVLEAQQRVRSRMEANPTRYFLGGEYQDELNSARRAVADLVAALEPDVRVLVDAAHAPGMIDFDVAALGASWATAPRHMGVVVAGRRGMHTGPGVGVRRTTAIRRAAAPGAGGHLGQAQRDLMVGSGDAV